MSASYGSIRLFVLFFSISLLSTIAVSQDLRSDGRKSAPFESSAKSVKKGQNLSRTDFGIPEYEKLVAAGQADVVSLNKLGILYINAKRYRDAAAVLEKAVKLAPELAGLHLNLSMAYGTLGRWTDALEPLRGRSLSNLILSLRMSICAGFSWC